MNSTNREIELKFVVSGASIKDIATAAKDAAGLEFEPTTEFSGMDLDTYFPLLSGDTLRIRKSGNSNAGVITFKQKDKDSNFNRKEINIVIHEYNTAFAYLQAVHGNFIGEIVKVYHKFEFKDGEIAVYRVIGDPEQRIFLEVEATSEKEVLTLVKKIGKALTLIPEPHSMAEIFIKG